MKPTSALVSTGFGALLPQPGSLQPVLGMSCEVCRPSSLPLAAKTVSRGGTDEVQEQMHHLPSGSLVLQGRCYSPVSTPFPCEAAQNLRTLCRLLVRCHAGAL